MAYEKKDNSAILFVNDKKMTETHPDFKGDALIGGVMYWVSMWKKTGKNGSDFYSLSLKPKDSVYDKKEELAKYTYTNNTAPNSFKYNDDDAVPF